MAASTTASATEYMVALAGCLLVLRTSANATVESPHFIRIPRSRHNDDR